MWSNVVLAGLLLGLSVGLTLRNLAAQRQRDQEDLGSRERDFYDHQSRRRFQVNVMIGIVGLTVLVGTRIREPVTMVIYWSVVGLFVLWIGLLAVADGYSSRAFFRQLHDRQRNEIVALGKELKRVGRPAAQGNGRAAPARREESHREES